MDVKLGQVNMDAVVFIDRFLLIVLDKAAVSIDEVTAQRRCFIIAVTWTWGPISTYLDKPIPIDLDTHGLFGEIRNPMHWNKALPMHTAEPPLSFPKK